MDSLKEELEREPRGYVERQVEIGAGEKARTIQTILNVLRDDSDNPQGFVCILEDLTDAIKAQRMSAWREVARRIAHEIKNPLTPIQLAAQRLRKRYGSRLGDDDKVFLDSTFTIIKQVETIKKLVKEFSDFARIAEAMPALCDLNEIIGEAVILFSEAHKSIRFMHDKSAELPRMMLDAEQIKRVFINLLDNAVAAIESKGEICIETRMAKDNDFVRISITDNGHGIPPEYKSRLFEPYFSTKKMGTGLGLAIVSRIIRDHGGSIVLEENKPKGTQVIIHLPVKAQAPLEDAEEGGEIAQNDNGR
jgi:two-component system nitrogen regulation sensor histidine kinase NtrY